jgi:acyl-[acyl-carrier-protein]-phospholipid O-acyltransferase/long-chain-fatty-acid--[acyl-carrier-protein] ligase
MPSNQVHLLRTRRFLPLFCVQFLGAFNDNVFKNAFVILLTYRLAADLGWDPKLGVTAIAGVFILPFFLFSAFAGSLADKFEKARFIRWTKVWEIAAMTLGAVAFHRQDAHLLFAVLFLMGMQSSFFGPLKYGILPDHLRPDELVAGNALFEAATFIAILTGTILGGLLILGENGATIVSVLAIALATAGWIASWWVPPAEPQPEGRLLRIDWNVPRGLWRLVAYARSQPPVFRPVLGISWFWVIGATWLTVIPAYVEGTLRADERAVTACLTLFAVGIGVGSLLCHRLLRGEISARWVPLAGLVCSLFMFDFVWLSAGLNDPGASPFTVKSWTAARLALDLFGIAVAGGLFSVPLYAMLQSRSAPDHRARNVATNNILNSFFMVIAAIVTAVLFALGWSIPQVILLLASLNVVVAGYTMTLVPDARLPRWLRTRLGHPPPG